jgi:anti-sigma regulatory factor (Ser/Thr protein kinase)
MPGFATTTDRFEGEVAVVDDGPARATMSEHEPVAAVTRQIRRALRTLLAGWGLAAEVVDDALLVVEELVANVVDHAHTPFQLAVRLTNRVLHVSVRDCAAGLPQVRPFDPDAARGRGLQVIASLAQRWGCDRHEGGKTVWADLAI